MDDGSRGFLHPRLLVLVYRGKMEDFQTSMSSSRGVSMEGIYVDSSSSSSAAKEVRILALVQLHGYQVWNRDVRIPFSKQGVPVSSQDEDVSPYPSLPRLVESSLLETGMRNEEEEEDEEEIEEDEEEIEGDEEEEESFVQAETAAGKDRSSTLDSHELFFSSFRAKL